MEERGKKPLDQSIPKTSELSREVEVKNQRILLIKKPFNPIENWEGKIKRWGWLFDRRLWIKNILIW